MEAATGCPQENLFRLVAQGPEYWAGDPGNDVTSTYDHRFSGQCLAFVQHGHLPFHPGNGRQDRLATRCNPIGPDGKRKKTMNAILNR